MDLVDNLSELKKSLSEEKKQLEAEEKKQKMLIQKYCSDFKTIATKITEHFDNEMTTLTKEIDVESVDHCLNVILSDGTLITFKMVKNENS